MRDGWTEMTLGDMAEVNPETTKGMPPQQRIRYIDLSAVSADSGIDESAVIDYELRSAPGRARRVVRHGDVLVSTVRPYLRGFAVVPESLDGAVASTGFTVLRAREELSLPGFVWSIVSKADFADRLMERATGSNYPAVRPNDIAEQVVLLPSLVVQRRVVDLVDAVDTYAVRARDVATAAEGLFRVLLAIWTTPSPDAVPLTDIAEVLDSRRVPVKASDREARGGDVPYYGAMGQAGWIDAALFDEPLVLLAEDGAGLDQWRTRPIAYKVDGPSWVNNHAHVLRPLTDMVSLEWLYLSLRHHDITGLSVSGTRPKLNRSALEQIRINLTPDVARQEAVLTAAEEAMIHAGSVALSVASLRQALLDELLSSSREIPQSYDDLVGLVA